MDHLESPEIDELDVVRRVRDLLFRLPVDARSRAFDYVIRLLNENSGLAETSESSSVNENPLSEQYDGNEFSGTFEKFIEQIDPQSDSDTALATAYWIQVKENAENFTASEINRHLIHLGRRIGNVTNALGSFQKNRPYYVIQVRKKGTTKQARKIYKVTAAGISAIDNMIKREI